MNLSFIPENNPKNSRNKKFCFFYLNFMMAMIVLVFIAGNVHSQSIYSGPAFGQITGGVQVSTTLFEGMPEINNPGSENRILNHYWELTKIQMVDDIYNRTPAASPPGSNLIFDPVVSRGVTQQIHAPFLWLDFRGGQDPGNTIPPDPDVAVGPYHVITVQNAPWIRIFSKEGILMQAINANNWFSTTIANPDVFDCHIIYDHFAERWIQIWLHVDDANQTSQWLLSVSDDSDPFGTWVNYAFPNHLNGMNNAYNFGDYPKIGYDQQAIYVSGRQFGFAGGFNYSKLRIIPKSQLYDPAAGPVDYTDIWSFRDPNNPGVVVDGPPIAANHMDSTDTAYLIVDAPYSTSTFITLWEITNSLSPTPIITATNIPTAVAPWPNDGNQLGGGSPRLDVGRRAYRRAIYKDGNIWSACPIGGGTSNLYTFARYVRLDVNAKTVLEDAALGADGYYYLYPTCLVDEDNNLTMVFTRSADTEYASAAYTGRRATDPPGLAPSVIFKEGESNYIKTFSGTRNRWGDYLGIALDPMYTNSIWGFVEYAASPENIFGVWTGAFTHQYALQGTIVAEQTGNPVAPAHLEVAETGFNFETDSSGQFRFGSPEPSLTLNVSAFEFRDTSLTVTLTLYSPDSLTIPLKPELQTVISGQVKDSTGQGIEATLYFYADGDPNPGPYDSVSTDPNGNYSLQTIIGVYDIEIFPEAPYEYALKEGIVAITPSLNYDITLSPADVMLVDGDRGSDYEKYYIRALTVAGKSYHIWDSQAQGAPTAAVRNSFPDRLIVWFTGDSSRNPISPAEELEIVDHISSGGKLFLTGQDIAEYTQTAGLLDTLGISFLQNTSLVLVRGVPGDVISSGLIINISSSGGANNQTSSDVIQVMDSTLTTEIFYYGAGVASPAGVRVEDVQHQSKTVFFGFGYEAINDSAKSTNLMSSILEYLSSPITGIDDRPSSGIPQKFELFQNFPNPFNPETTIRFSVPKKAGIEINIFNSLGQKVRQLTSELYGAGYHEVIWDGKDDSLIPMSSGVYFYQMTNKSDFSQVKKLLLLK